MLLVMASAASLSRMCCPFEARLPLLKQSFVQTFVEHEAEVTAVHFAASGSGLHLVSSGADRAIVFRLLASAGKLAILRACTDNNGRAQVMTLNRLWCLSKATYVVCSRYAVLTCGEREDAPWYSH